jgi:2-polyprenyl-3-methyl-5-hydroxy-6-metoxy-1,4-benzoquinol methylase
LVSRYHNNIRSDVFDYLPKTANSILEVGGGTGVTCAAAKKICGAANAGVIDLSSEAIEASTSGLDFAVCGDIGNPDFLKLICKSHGPFDLILCLDILEHLVDPWAAVEKLHSLLEPGGYILTSIPNVRYFDVSLRLVVRGSWSYADAGILDRTHLRFFTKKTAIKLMTSSGLKVDKIGSRFAPRKENEFRIINNFTLGLFRELLDFQYFILVKDVR